MEPAPALGQKSIGVHDVGGVLRLSQTADSSQCGRSFATRVYAGDVEKVDAGMIEAFQVKSPAR